MRNWINFKMLALYTPFKTIVSVQSNTALCLVRVIVLFS